MASLRAIFFRGATSLQYFRGISTSRYNLSQIQPAFDRATKIAGSSIESTSNEEKLQIYALFKQATQGECRAKKPSAFDLIGGAKWKAWKDLGAISQEDAKRSYIELVSKLSGKPIETGASSEGGSVPSSTSEAPAKQVAPPPAPVRPTEASAASGETLTLPTGEGFRLTLAPNGLATLTFNRLTKKNALTLEMYAEFTKISKQLAADDRVRVLAVTGEGDYFTSGNDLSNLTRFITTDSSNLEADMKKGIEKSVATIVPFMKSLYQFPKLMVALVNGPAIGIGLTMLAHFDLVLAARNATFHTPFIRLGIVPEAASSYLFPRLLGRTRASQLLLLGEKINAEQAHQWGLVSHLFPPAPEFNAQVTEFLNEQVLSLPPNAMRLGRQLLHAYDRELLEKSTLYEIEVLSRTWEHDEVKQAALSFFSNRGARSKTQ